jgi:hypothetical protein
MRDLEHLIQVAFFNRAHYLALQVPAFAELFAIPNGGMRSKATAGKLKAEGVKSGVWDICLPVPAHGRHGLWIEMKAGDNFLSPAQQEFGLARLGFGYTCSLAYSADDAEAAVRRYLESGAGNWNGEKTRGIWNKRARN